MIMSNSADLKREVDRLTFDLQQACQEKVQAAEYGLAVLEEKQTLHEKYDDLETAFEKIKYELVQAGEQITLLQSKNDSLAQKVEHKQGNIVQECSSMESAFAMKVCELQVELKKIKKSERSAIRETGSIKQQLASLQKSYNFLIDENKQLGQEVKDKKLRESQFDEEYNLLEEENTSLQKALSKLKQTLVEYEGLKVEKKSLLDEVDSLQLQLHVTTGACGQFERQLNEALDSVKEHRERHIHYQKEIHELKQQSIMNSWNMDHTVKDFGDNPIIKQISEEFKNLQPVPASGMVDDLLKELQFTEMQELEEQLRVVNEEKQGLVEQLSKTKFPVQCGIPNTSNTRDKNSIDYSDPEEGDEYTMNNKSEEPSDLKECNKHLRNLESVNQMEIKRMSEEIGELKGLLSNVENEKNALLKNSNDESKKLSDELLQVKSKLRESQSNIKKLNADITMLNEISGESQGCLNSTQNELKNMYNDLLRLNETLNNNKIKEGESISTVCEDKSSSTGIGSGNTPSNQGTPAECFKSMTQVKEQFRILQLTLCKLLNKGCNSVTNDLNDQSQENLHLKEQILKLQSLVATKREQISTLRTVLKANKSTYEVALTNLKSRYENDKDVQAETNSQLKRQIKALKSECLTFTSMRSMFAGRCDDYMKQLLEKELIIKAAEDEKRTLNNLLKTAIHQKITVKQKLEEFEIARERLRQFTKKNIKLPAKENSKGASSPSRPVTRV